MDKNVTNLCTPKIIELIKNRSENRKTNNIPFIPGEYVRGLRSKSRWKVLRPNNVYKTNPYEGNGSVTMPKSYSGTYAYLNNNSYEPSRKVKGTSYGAIRVGEVLKGEKSSFVLLLRTEDSSLISTDSSVDHSSFLDHIERSCY